MAVSDLRLLALNADPLVENNVANQLELACENISLEQVVGSGTDAAGTELHLLDNLLEIELSGSSNV